jgi:hypothetical protein
MTSVVATGTEFQTVPVIIMALRHVQLALRIAPERQKLEQKGGLATEQELQKRRIAHCRRRIRDESVAIARGTGQ